MRDITKIKNPEIKKITKLINSVKQNSIRNALTHGRQRVVNREEINSSLNAFKILEEEFEAIYQKTLATKW